MSVKTGYASPEYARSLAQWGVPGALPKSEASILRRRIPGTDHSDAMGPYPLLACWDWSRLEEDLDDLSADLVSLSAVTDPFGEYDEDLLRQCFGEVVIPFKDHFVTDLSEVQTSKHHRYYARKAREKVYVEVCEEPQRQLDEWTALYANLAKRNGLTEIKTFSRESFAHQLTVPGLVMLRASAEGETVAMHLWYVSGEVAYSHLAASGERGYELMASYALYDAAIEHFTGKVRWLDLGGGAGTGEGAGGLSQFKRGWSNETRMAYFCGRVFDREVYDRLSRGSGAGYFPAYRAGEFG